MKRCLLIVITLFLVLPALQAQHRGYSRIRAEVVGRDTMMVVDVIPVMVFKRPIDARRYARLIYNLKKVYPIAKEANRMLEAMEEHLKTLKSKKAQDAFVKAMEREIKAKYTPVLRKMTFSQGKILIKLIDRETSRTSYQLVKEFRGGFSAFLWQGVARIFGANLKDRYDKDGDDKIIEKLIILYEAGLLDTPETSGKKPGSGLLMIPDPDFL